MARLFNLTRQGQIHTPGKNASPKGGRAGQAVISTLFTHRGTTHGSRSFCEIVVLVEIAIHDSGQFGGLGSVYRVIAFEEDDGNNAPILRICERAEPAEARPGVAASPGFAQHLLRVKAGAQPARGAVLRGAQHAHADLGDQRRGCAGMPPSAARSPPTPESCARCAPRDGWTAWLQSRSSRATAPGTQSL